MSESISQRALRNERGRIMREPDAGHSFIATRNSVRAGELRPLRRTRLVVRSVVLSDFQGARGIDRDGFVADLDAVVDQGPEPRA